ncbi:MAG: branched-chain amino acid ABC transporter permease [Ancalomicrobiaceae bacterium]|nr:branched-chain amino acid ABC transporter permease [Ancalomicrobiaceae bacterium]
MTADLAGILTYGSFFLVTALSYAILCLGLNLQWGHTGLFNVGIAGFVAIGGYTSAILTTPASDQHLGGFGLPIAVGWIAAMVTAGLASALVGALTLRLRSDYLAITTFGVAVVIHLVALNAQRLTGGPFGIGFIPRPFGDLADKPLLFTGLNLALVAAILLVLALGLERLLHGPWGRVLRAIREDEKAAEALGKSPVRLRLEAFTLGGAIMGLAGAVHGHFIGFIAPDNYQSGLTFQVWAMLIVGGAGNSRGAVIGAVIVWGLWSVSGLAIGGLFPPADQARASSLQLVAIGSMLVAMLLFRPGGILGERTIVSRWVKQR